MATLGTLNLLEAETSYDSGLALLLVRPPKEARTFTHAEAQFQVAADTPFIVCSFSGESSHSEAFKRGFDLIQEGLDMLSMTGGPDLSTHDAGNEYFTWWNNSGQKTIAAVTTATTIWSVGSAELTVRDSAGNIVPPIKVVPQHHPGFRYYRLSQVSDDLFDAYRNMYLALELLLSTRYPKKGGEEKWLKDSLTKVDKDLNLARFSPAGHSDPIKYFVSEIYNNARLPLFHAKNGWRYFIPQASDQERDKIISSLRLLTLIVRCMAAAWYDIHVRGGMVSEEILYGGLQELLSSAEFVLSSDAYANADDAIRASTSIGTENRNKPF